MTKWLRAMNPLLPPRAMAEARWAAQTLVFAFALSFVGGVPGLIWMALQPDWVAQVATSQFASTRLPAEEFAELQPTFNAVMPSLLIGSSLVTLVVYAVLSWVQWRELTRWIPILWLAFFAYGWLMRGLRWATGTVDVITFGPPWMYVFAQACSIGAAVIAVASLRGALAWRRLQREP